MIDEVNFDELFGKKSETTQKAKSAPAKKQTKPSAAKPASAKGQYIRSCVTASTMGPGVKINAQKQL